MSPVLFLTLCLGMASAAPTLDPILDAQWHQWKTKYGKKYSTSEEEHRRGVWEKNMQMIELHNKEHSEGKHSFTMEMNTFGDMNSTEFWKTMSGLQIDTTETIVKQRSLDLPKLERLDRRENSYVLGQDGLCRYKPENSTANVTGTVYLPAQEDALVDAVATLGPICAAIDAKLPSFQFYKDGIYYDSRCSDIYVNNAVLVVGYGFDGEESDGNHYWLIKNSWGVEWGIGGYMKLAKDRNNHCGIATAAINPAV